MQSRYEPSGDTEVRVNWSPWTHCESSFGLVLTPHAPGVYAVAEEVTPASDTAGVPARRLLAMVHIGASDDLGRDLAHLFAPASPVHDRLAEGNCYLRYAVIADLAVRDLVLESLHEWMESANETATGIARSAPAAPAHAEGVAQFARWPDGF